MGTRSLTIFQENKQDVCVLYRQFDGYPSVHGTELANFLDGFKLVNGYNGSEPAKAANSIGCLAAQVIAHFKIGIGSFYIEPCGTRGAGEEYLYIVTEANGKPWIECQDDNGTTLFQGQPDQFLGWAATQD